MTLATWEKIAGIISEQTGRDFSPAPPRIHHGGCINDAFTLSDEHNAWFVKTNHASQHDMFEAEAEGLEALFETNTFVVPKPLCTGMLDETAFIIMQRLQLGRGNPAAWQSAGRQLATLHRRTAESFGWTRANTIGATPQSNNWQADWVDFWREQRLGFQLREAARNGYTGTLQRHGDKLLSRFPSLIDHAPSPSLLHGDLWSGNLAFTDDNQPAVYDPAVYFGDREADLAMTELFGGFSADFYASYRTEWPIDPGYAVRKTLYNLYHILNHLNLFGGGYGAQAEQMMQRLLTEC